MNNSRGAKMPTPEEIQAQEEAKQEQVEAEKNAEEVAEDESPVMEYASKQDLEKLKVEFMSIIESLMKKEEEYKKEVPAELSAEEPVEEISHSPESGIETKSKFVIGGNRAMTTKDRVFAKMFNN